MHVFRLSIFLMLVYLPLHSQEGFPLVRTRPSKLSFPDHVIPRFNTSDFQDLAEKKLYQMAYDSINDRIAQDSDLMRVAIRASDANIEFVKAILQHSAVQSGYRFRQHASGIYAALGRGYWDVFHFLHEYEWTEAGFSEGFYTNFPLDQVVDTYVVGLIIAAEVGRFDFLFHELRWRESNREKWSDSLKFICIRSRCDLNDVAVPPYSAYRDPGDPVNRLSYKEEYSLALHAAVDRNQKVVVVLLLQNGADPCKEDHEGDTALSIAQRKNDFYSGIKKILELFIRYRGHITQINTEKNSHEFICKILKACPALASHYLKDTYGNTLLHYAVKANDIVLITTLLERDPLLALEENEYGFTPLECSFLDGKHEALKALLAYAYRVYTSPRRFFANTDGLPPQPFPSFSHTTAFLI